jgi:adenylate kinase family enzyme
VVVAESELAGLRQARRILVLGSPGSGKTLLSAELARHLGLDVLRLDDFFWRPGRMRMPTDAWRMRVAELANRPCWVMDGTYEASLDLRLPTAEAIVYIRSNRWVCLWRVVVRRLLRRWRPAAESALGHALTPFFIRYVVRFPTTTQPEVFALIARHGGGKPVIVLEGAQAVDRLIQQLRQRNAAAVSGASSPQPQDA